MPLSRFLILLASVLFLAGVTVALLAIGGPSVLIAALPAFAIVAVAVRVFK